jgi:hypothetical protein
VLPLVGVELYARRGGLWYRLGHHLPTFGLPADEGESVPLDRAVTPTPVRPELASDILPRPVELRLVRDGRVREASALGCGLDELGRWADMAPTARLVALRAATAGDRVLLLGRPLPPIPGAERFWGGRILVPLGVRADPELPETALCGALGAGDDELLVLTHEGAEAVPLDRAVTPTPVRPELPADPLPRPVELALVRDGRVREASALGFGLDELGRWADMAPTARLIALRAAMAGDRVLLLGRPLPPIAGAERFWGGRILVPLGFRTDPELPEPALCGALGAGDEEFLVLTHEGAETVPIRAFRTLTRAGVRLALEARPT